MADPTELAGRDTGLRGRRILVVEDVYIIANDIARRLRSLGCEPLGPAADMSSGIELLASEERRNGLPDAVVLDIHLGSGEMVFPMAEALGQRGIPFLFVTGYGARAIPDAWRHVPRLQKPLGSHDLEAGLRTLLQAAPAGAQPGVAALIRPQAGVRSATDKAAKDTETQENIRTAEDRVRRSRNLRMEVAALRASRALPRDGMPTAQQIGKPGPKRET
jgi:CheY-like chemotaxis protein